MAASPFNLKTRYHARSISFPSRSHPLTARVEEQLCRMKASESSSSSSLSSICHNLGGLKDLYDCVDDLLQLPLTQQSLARQQHESWTTGVLDGSLRLLDVCGTTRDVLLQMKESLQHLQSSIRRKRGDSGIANDVSTYTLSRKKLIKAIHKSLGDLKRTENKHTSSSSSLLGKDHDLVAMVSVLREVEEITLSTLKSLLSFLSRPAALSRSKGWSLVSKLMYNRREVAKEGEDADWCDMEEVDIALSNLIRQKPSNKDGEIVQKVRKQLETLELSIQDLEDGLGYIFGSLVKTRVSFLNVLNH
ncbi:PREDICTED: uncharacterized protein LOC104587127 [Nelumbo nucifera]|uniref:Uncharacterized protein LOC104587127 n=2 Tax=Nelumbo nucifera TaxID=4432 RepID=A0A1U7YUJ2_NELNU|nr:PREDICTED: uncharacterized protein LOC104587127 [Nelumbo nucifera]DAD46590.1 TPA_asm: hypothetical protein HUJ06_016527 [Nelumbo nucifera]